MDEKLNQEEIKWLVKTLRKIEFFSTVSFDDIDKLISRFFRKKYPVGAEIINEGSHGKALFVIKSGRCQVYKKKSFFRREKIAVLKEGDFFGEMSLVLDDPTCVFVVTLEPTEVFVFLKIDFLALLATNKNLESDIRRIAEKRRMDNCN